MNFNVPIVHAGNMAVADFQFHIKTGDPNISTVEASFIEPDGIEHFVEATQLATNRFLAKHPIPADTPLGRWVARMKVLIGPDALHEEAFDIGPSMVHEEGIPVPITEHSDLTGLLDNDHPQYALKSRESMVNAKDYGAVGNGTTDDTAALQAWATYVSSNHKVGFLPNGTYKITAPIIFTDAPSWSVTGESYSSQFTFGPGIGTVVRQFTNNTPCFQIGTPADTGSSTTNAISISNITFCASSQQTTAATNSVGIAFYVMVYHSNFENMYFLYTCYGMKTMSATDLPPWGCYFNNLNCRGMAIGMIHFSNSTSAGNPNNFFGRMTMFCDNAIGPILYLGALGSHFTALEFLVANNNPRLLEMPLSQQVTIDVMRLEICNYTEAETLFYFPGNCSVDIGFVEITGTPCTLSPASGELIFFHAGMNDTPPIGWRVHIGTLEIATTATVTGTVAAFKGEIVVPTPSSGGFEIGHVMLHGLVPLTVSDAGNHTANCVMVNSWQNGRLSYSQPDANYTVTYGDQNKVYFSQAFTAQRTITLPAKENGNNFNGLSYTFIFTNGAINGANTAVIKEGANTLRTQTVDKVAITYSWLHQWASTGSWIMTSYETLP